MKLYQADDSRGERLLRRLEGRRAALLTDQVFARARAVINEIRRRGDAALLKHIRAAAGGNTGVHAATPDAATPPPIADELARALDASIDAAVRFHRPQVLDGYTQQSEGSELSLRVRPVPSVGVVLGGRRHPDLTSLIMVAVPARLAGVPRLAVAVPPALWQESPPLRHLLRRLEVEDVYLMSGVHAVAALAVGTESVAPVEMVVASGDARLLAAKHLVAPQVAVDVRGGPSELAILADAAADPSLVAADLLAQLEHDPDAMGVVVTASARLARKVSSLVTSRARRLPRGAVVREALRRWGAILVVADDIEACAVLNRIAPSRVELLISEPERLVDRIEAAATITLGPWSPPALIDVVGGVNHLLPTLGLSVARGPLAVWDFYRTTAVVRVAPSHYPKLSALAGLLTEAEELPLHGASLTAGRRGDR